ncbi:MAG TPA: hypothetical protein VF559_12665 [Caulobacteraceae bacterium]|jgi:hypothetical protein
MLIGWKGAGSDRAVASLRYRVEAPVEALRARGQPVELFDAANAEAYDTVVFAKAYGDAERELARAVKARGGRVVFDLCDNHFHNPYALPRYVRAREQLLDMLALADVVTCTTPALAEVIRAEAPEAPEPVVIGDLVEALPPASPSLEPFEGLRLLWFGSHGSPNAPSGMADLLLIERQLAALGARTPLQLVVCSNDRGKYERLIAPLKLDSRYVDWKLESFPGVLASADAVVIPVSPNPFTACKSHNRLTLALHAGVPVIADAIDSYREFGPWCTLDDWNGGFERLLAATDEERRRAEASRPHLESRWSMAALAPQWERALGLEPKAQRAGNGVRTNNRPLACQGAVDPRAAGAITGWVRAPSDPSRKLTVRLERDGQTLADAVADLPRADLERAGMRGCDCGFSLPLPPEPETAFRLVTETNWDFDEPRVRLLDDGRPGLKVMFERGRIAEPPAAAVTTASPRTIAAPAPASAMAAQEELLAELERISALMEEARQAAARLVVATGHDPRLARRALSILSGHGPAAAPALSALSEADQRQAGRLN